MENIETVSAFASVFIPSANSRLPSKSKPTDSNWGIGGDAYFFKKESLPLCHPRQHPCSSSDSSTREDFLHVPTNLSWHPDERCACRTTFQHYTGEGIFPAGLTLIKRKCYPDPHEVGNIFYFSIPFFLLLIFLDSQVDGQVCRPISLGLDQYGCLGVRLKYL